MSILVIRSLSAISACQHFLTVIGIVGAMQGGGGSSPVEPGSMLWLIQRDFLEGKTVQTMVSEALQPVPNPFHDQDIAQVAHSARLALDAISCRDLFSVYRRKHYVEESFCFLILYLLSAANQGQYRHNDSVFDGPPLTADTS